MWMWGLYCHSSLLEVKKKKKQKPQKKHRYLKLQTEVRKRNVTSKLRDSEIEWKKALLLKKVCIDR